MMEKPDGGDSHALPGRKRSDGGKSYCRECRVEGGHLPTCSLFGLVDREEKSKALPAMGECTECGGLRCHHDGCLWITPTEKPDALPKGCRDCGNLYMHRRSCLWRNGTLEGMPVLPSQRVGYTATVEPIRGEQEELEETEVKADHVVTVRFYDNASRGMILGLKLTHDMSWLVPSTGDYISPFGDEDGTRIYRVVSRHLILSQKPSIVIYLDKPENV